MTQTRSWRSVSVPSYTTLPQRCITRRGNAEKACNDDWNKYMTQFIQISEIVHSCFGLADQGGVLAGVADKPFFRTSPSRALVHIIHE
jgi:hypothetical protein